MAEPHEGFPKQLDPPTTDVLDQYPLESALPSFGDKYYGHAPHSSDYWSAIVSGPHGKNKAIGDYGRVLMLATGFGIAAQLPHLKALVQGFHDYRVRTREVVLVWQIERYSTSSELCYSRNSFDLVDREPAKDLIDRILRHDFLTKGYVRFHHALATGYLT